uniref:Uncharacterized protein n=1 Tax=Panagrolaimus sp. JU765 TaxID=591449 RepID=A0AC34R6M0_9BILA
MNTYERKEIHETVKKDHCDDEKEHKSIFTKIKDKITGKDKDECYKCTVQVKCSEHFLSEADKHEKEAHDLRESGLKSLKKTQKEFFEAENAQKQAKIASEQANFKTIQALNDQARGQTLLAEAGAEMIEAGSKLQQQAANTQIGHVPFNEHFENNIQQMTCVSSAGQEAACHAHEQEVIRTVQFSEAH